MKRLLMILVLTQAAIVAQAANLSGRWEVEIARAGGGRPQTLYLTLYQVGSEVTGELAASALPYTGSPSYTQVWEGRVEGDTISFYVWTGHDRVAKVLYKGKLVGEEIHFTVTGGAPSFNVRGEMNPPPAPRTAVAKRTRL